VSPSLTARVNHSGKLTQPSLNKTTNGSKTTVQMMSDYEELELDLM
jgi:hypothetical protein